MKQRDDTYLLDMLLAARRVRAYMEGVDRERLEADAVLQDPVAHRLQILGEAASRVSPSTRESHPGLPWREMTGLRNRIVHEYSRVDLDIIWEVVQGDLAPVIADLEGIVPPEGSTPP